MIVLLGKTGAGKSRIQNEMVKRGYNKIVTLTTRPLRPNEVNGRDYEFVKEDTFKEYINTEFLAEYDVFHTAFGDWYYGSFLTSYTFSAPNDIVVLTPRGYSNIKKVLKDTPVKFESFYIDVDYDIQRKRLEIRGDNESEVIRRMEADKIDFYGVESQVDHVVKNNSTIDTAVNSIIEILMGGDKSDTE